MSSAMKLFVVAAAWATALGASAATTRGLARCL